MARSLSRRPRRAPDAPLSRPDLGDSHNFGRRVTAHGPDAEWIRKPRTVVWERLVLDGKSALRRALDAAARASEAPSLGPDAFGFLPSLKFAAARGRAPAGSGDVERVVLAPLPKLSNARRRDLAQIVGRALALFTWLGVSDLHWENLVLGVGPRGDTIFAPLDVEMILADLALPTETKLVPDADPEYAAICRHAAGVRRVLPYLGKPIDVADLVAMASAYRATLELLDAHAPAIAEVFARLPHLDATPIRVCLRGTGDYVRARSEPVWPPLLAGESEQLARGDIPYFFRLYGKRGIHYYAEPTLERLAHLPLRGDVPQLDPMLSIARGLRARSRTTLREEGLLAVIGAFDHPSFDGEHTVDGLTVRFGARSLVVRTAASAGRGEELHARRDLRAYVGSVYLPCRCGEVRSVFVPAVTVCDAGG